MKAIAVALCIGLMSFILPSITSPNIYQFTMKSIEGKPVPLAQYKGKVVIIVNTASKCGLTPQYADLEKFYKEYKGKGVVVLGFPANNFMKQEPGSNEEIKGFCEKNYGVTFDMFEKIEVKGKEIHPLYAFLTQKSQNGTVESEVSWNFQKFVINKKGEVVASFSPRAGIYDAEVVELVNKLVAE